MKQAESVRDEKVLREVVVVWCSRQAQCYARWVMLYVPVRAVAGASRRCAAGAGERHVCAHCFIGDMQKSLLTFSKVLHGVVVVVWW